MGPKKKIEAPQPVAQPVVIQQKTISNRDLVIRSDDGKEHKISQLLFTRYSTKLKLLVEDVKEDIIHIPDSTAETIQLVFQFLNLHAEIQPVKINLPIKTNQSLKYIMEEKDAELIDRIFQKGDDLVLQMLNLVTSMEIESLKKRIICGVAVKLMKNTLEELKEEYELQDDSFAQDDLRMQMRAKIEMLKNIEDE